MRKLCAVPQLVEFAVNKILYLLLIVLFTSSCYKPGLPEIPDRLPEDDNPEAFVYIENSGVLHEYDVNLKDNGNLLELGFRGAYREVGSTDGVAAEDIDIDFKMDLTLVDIYNSQNGTNYLPLPATSVNEDFFSLQIEKGMKETSLLKFTIDLEAGMLPLTEYLLPVTIDKVDKNAKIDERERTIFYKISYENNTVSVVKVGVYSHTYTNYDMQLIAGVVETHKPDVLVIRVIERNTDRSGTINTLEILKGLIELKYYEFAKAQNFQNGEIGMAVFSRYPINNFKPYGLETGLTEKRPFCTMDLDVNGHTLAFAAVHLDPNQTKREEQIVTAVGHLATIDEEVPLIFAGLMSENPFTDPKGFVYTKLADVGLQTPCSPCAPNYGATATTWSDMITYRSSEKFSVLEHTVEPLSSFFDHRPIFTSFEIDFD